jgi:hypothetical protein
MIPSIGIMIAGYIFARLFEICCKPESSFSCTAARGFVLLFSILGMIGAIITALNLFLSPSLPKQF